MTPSPTPTIAAFTAAASDAEWWMVWLTAIGIVATLLIALLTFGANRRADASRKVAESAQVEALKASALAYNESAAATREQVAAIAELVAATNDRPAAAVSDAAASSVRWTIERDRSAKNRWRIHNTGNAVARQVTIAGVSKSDQADILRLTDEAIDIAPSNSLSFGIWKSIASPAATTVEVRWLDENGADRVERMVAF
ncbi:hypothetical protein FQ142_10175 [Microbacterium sp. ANT_H45B]|uniref:hypothetical protein n=1 Tax=Microbacterium sp. ANT_H45B TaxID=2597346 RepID=UPI0011EDD3EF|nr:hypothetical protein [Microbacterium sp. ANT_H45B]KAA0961200.1 hypothetical protein FQ142_10175 [Microbacterium sp. ANT_H45B]